MALSGATPPDGADPTEDPLIKEVLRLWSVVGNGFVKDFGLGTVALELAGGFRGTRTEMLMALDLLGFLYNHALEEQRRQNESKR
jgi:hypothetical protein